jgi:hypothetical protein
MGMSLGALGLLPGTPEIGDGGASEAVRAAIIREQQALAGTKKATLPFREAGKDIASYLQESVTDPGHFLNTYAGRKGSAAIGKRASRLGLAEAGQQVAGEYRTTRGVIAGRNKFARGLGLAKMGQALRRQVVSPSMAGMAVKTAAGLQQDAITKAGAQWNMYAAPVKYGLAGLMAWDATRGGGGAAPTPYTDRWNADASAMTTFDY